MNRINNGLEQAAPVRSGNNGGKPSLTGEVNIRHPHLLASCNGFSPVREEYKKLKARVMRLTREEPFRNVLLVTSAVGGEGKSVTAANLALSLARDYDHSVLLVDADTRKPSLHTLLNVKPETGLMDSLAAGTDIADSLIRIGGGRLQFLPAGRPADNCVELFSSVRMEKLVLEMKRRYPDRYVIIDTPPVLLFAETKIMSGLADGIIFVVREGLAPVQHVVEALELLKEEPLLGVVYNDAGPESNGHYPYHSYYDRYKKK